MFRYLKNLQSFNNITKRNFSNESKKLIDMKINENTGFATITLQHLPVNSLNLELLTDLSNTLDSVEEHRCKGMILTSASNKVFSAGLHLFDMYKPDVDRVKAMWSMLQEVWLKLYGSTYPTVAAINGHSPAGGCLLSLACEYRVMVNAFTIGFNETQLGIIAPSWCQASMRNALSNRDTELALTNGKMFTTDEALKVGLVDETAMNKHDALAKAETFLLRFKNMSAQVRSITKLALRSADIKALEEIREHDVKLFVDLVMQPEVQERIGAYIESLKKK